MKRKKTIRKRGEKNRNNSFIVARERHKKKKKIRLGLCHDIVITMSGWYERPSVILLYCQYYYRDRWERRWTSGADINSSVACTNSHKTTSETVGITNVFFFIIRVRVDTADAGRPRFVHRYLDEKNVSMHENY